MTDSLPNKEQIQEGIQRFVEEQTPNEDGTCKNGKCYGRLIQQVSGLYQGRYSYTTPRCKKCGREYLLGGKWATKTGHTEFHEMLRRPFTI